MFLACAYLSPSRPARVLPEVSGCRSASASEGLAGDSRIRARRWSKERRPRGLKLRRADAVSGSRGSRPVVQGPYRRPGSARLPGASPGGGVPSVLSGADLGPVLRLAAFVPSERFQIEVNPAGEVRAQALKALGRQPSLVAPKRGTRDQRRRGARRGRPHAGTACLPVSARPRGRGRPRLAPPLFIKRTRKANGQTPEPSGLRGYWCFS